MTCTHDRFSEVHKFEKQPLDKRALKLMKSCAAAVMEEYSDLIFSYGYSDEFRYLQACSSHFLACFHLNCNFLTFVTWSSVVRCSFIFKKESKFYQRRERFVVITTFRC